MDNLFTLIFICSLVGLIWSLSRPQSFSWLLSDKTNRKSAGLLFGALLIASFIGIGVTAPSVSRTANLTNTGSVKSASTVSPAKTVTPTPSPSTTPTPSVATPTPYVAPASTPTSSSDSGLSNNNYYTNSDGSQVHSPADSTNGQVPAGATALCADGTYSFSQHHSGTCSYHGGVAQWLN